MNSAEKSVDLVHTVLFEGLELDCHVSGSLHGELILSLRADVARQFIGLMIAMLMDGELVFTVDSLTYVATRIDARSKGLAYIHLR